MRGNHRSQSGWGKVRSGSGVPRAEYPRQATPAAIWVCFADAVRAGRRRCGNHRASALGAADECASGKQARPGTSSQGLPDGAVRRGRSTVVKQGDAQAVTRNSQRVDASLCFTDVEQPCPPHLPFLRFMASQPTVFGFPVIKLDSHGPKEPLHLGTLAMTPPKPQSPDFPKRIHHTVRQSHGGFRSQGG